MLCKWLGVPVGPPGQPAPHAKTGPGGAATSTSPAAALGRLGEPVVAAGTLAAYLAYLGTVYLSLIHISQGIVR